MPPKKVIITETEVETPPVNNVVNTTCACSCSCQESRGYQYHHQHAKIIIAGIVIALFGFMMLVGMSSYSGQGFHHGYRYCNNYGYANNYDYNGYRYNGGPGMMNGGTTVAPGRSAPTQTLP